jgi:transposase
MNRPSLVELRTDVLQRAGAMTQVRKTFKVRLYHNRRNKRLHRRIDVAGLIWNHMVALQRRTYRLSGKYISRYDMQRHLAKLRKHSPRFAHWQLVGSQAVQELAERHDKAYQRFFAYKRGEGPRHDRPRFKKARQYSSFTLKQAAGSTKAAIVFSSTAQGTSSLSPGRLRATSRR